MASIPEEDIESANRTLRECIEQAQRLNARAQQLLRHYREEHARAKRRERR